MIEPPSYIISIIMSFKDSRLFYYCFLLQDLNTCYNISNRKSEKNHELDTY